MENLSFTRAGHAERFDRPSLSNRVNYTFFAIFFSGRRVAELEMYVFICKVNFISGLLFSFSKLFHEIGL